MRLWGKHMEKVRIRIEGQDELVEVVETYPLGQPKLVKFEGTVLHVGVQDELSLVLHDMTPVKLALSILKNRVEEAVASIADDIREEIKDKNLTRAGDVYQVISEMCEAHNLVIYTDSAKFVVMCLPDDGLTEYPRYADGSIPWSGWAAVALEAAVNTALGDVQQLIKDARNTEAAEDE